MLAADTAAPPQAPPSWFVARTLVDKGLSFGAWLALVLVSYAAAFPRTSPELRWPYVLFIVYFSWLYFRLWAVPLWALNTLKQLEQPPQTLPPSAHHPLLIVLVAAYKAQGSIGSVLRALKHQRYPADRFRVYVITQVAENSEKWERYVAVAEAVRRAIDGVGTTDRSEATLAVLATLVGEGRRSQADMVSDVPRYSIAGLLLGWPTPVLAERLTRMLMADLFRAEHQGRPLTTVSDALTPLGIELDQNSVRAAERLVACCSRRSERVIEDFRTILGIPEGESIFSDPAKPSHLAVTLAGEGLGSTWTRAILARRWEQAITVWLNELSSRVHDARQELATMPDFEVRLRLAYDDFERTCPEVVDEAIRTCGPHFHHICRAKVGGGKPESLNTAYAMLIESGQLVVNHDTHFVVIDADSLLHSSSLAVVAREITSDPDRNVIRQIAPISTSNYPGNNVFVKMVCCLDTIGSMGKWARSTRTLDRPDLPAGSGLVIPSTVLELLRQTKGTPWDGSTITEDARLVISDYGVLDGVTRRTKFVPIHLLEAVPEGKSLLNVFRQYWTQRMRWASGGPDELRQLARTFGAPQIYARQPPQQGFDVVRLGGYQGLLVRARHIRLMIRWASDHFWWGPGYGLAPLVWLAFGFVYITPSLFDVIGVCLLFGLPAWTVLIVFRRFSRFVPGGLSAGGLLRLYCGTLVFATCHTWPIIYTQFLYLVGRSDRFRTWTTTAKPRF